MSVVLLVAGQVALTLAAFLFRLDAGFAVLGACLLFTGWASRPVPKPPQE